MSLNSLIQSAQYRLSLPIISTDFYGKLLEVRISIEVPATFNTLSITQHCIESSILYMTTNELTIQIAFIYKFIAL